MVEKRPVQLLQQEDIVKATSTPEKNKIEEMNQKLAEKMRQMEQLCLESDSPANLIEQVEQVK
jgi:hypothetical protein